MKKLLFVLFAFISANSFAQKWETIKGNGQVKKETRELSNFTSLSSQGSMNVQIAYGNSNTIVVEADENLLPYIETTVENGKLLIKPKKNVNLKSKSRMNVYVSMTKINSLQLSGSGNINGSGAFTNDDKTDMAVSGSGNLSLSFDTFKDLDLSIAGSGNIDLKGKGTNTISAHISGSGNIDCSDINSNDVDAKISGSGNVKVYASNSIDAKISGSGNVFYKGTATKINSKVAGSGKVLKM
jgi:Putative auto-transporter adhesin, head GIN domain